VRRCRGWWAPAASGLCRGLVVCARPRGVASGASVIAADSTDSRAASTPKLAPPSRRRFASPPPATSTANPPAHPPNGAPTPSSTCAAASSTTNTTAGVAATGRTSTSSPASATSNSGARAGSWTGRSWTARPCNVCSATPPCTGVRGRTHQHPGLRDHHTHGARQPVQCPGNPRWPLPVPRL
jgi:hypothetical protein